MHWPVPDMRTAFLLFLAFLLIGCEKLSGAADQKIYDAEAIGYACRISLKKPEDCMKENDTQSPSSVLDGWKSADRDIKEKVIDVSMGSRPLMTNKNEDAAETGTPSPQGNDASKPDEAVQP